MSKIASLKSHVERWGVAATVRFLLLRIASDLLGVHLFIARGGQTSEHFSNPCKSPEIRFRRVEPDEWPKFAGDEGLLLDTDFERGAMARKDILFGAFDGPNLVAYVWRTTTAAPHTDDVWVRVRSPYCYSYKSFTRPDYRGLRIVPALILYSDQAMRELGYTHRVGIVELSNLASLAMSPSIGSRYIGRLAYLHWFGRYFFFRSSAVENIGMEFFERQP